MANMHEIKLRIKSIKETRQITKAMKLISAAKLKKARQQLEHTLPYFDKVKITMADILMHSADMNNVFFEKRAGKKDRKKGYIILTGDKGLAGGYNHNIIKLAESQLKENPEAVLLVAGHMGRGHFARKNFNVFFNFDYPVQNPTVFRAREIAEMVLELFKREELDEVYIVYTMMHSTINLEPQVMKLLPLDIDNLKQELNIPEGLQTNTEQDLVYEPSPAAVFDVLVPKYIKGIIYGTLVEAFASEQSARMAAMDNATANADEMLYKLNLFYNRARQAAITQEISEIVGGAAALR